MAGIHITDIEAAINFWRERAPSPDGVALPKPTRALAEVYALLVYFRETEADEATLPAAAREASSASAEITVRVLLPAPFHDATTRELPQFQGIQILVVGNQADSIRESLKELRQLMKPKAD